MIAGCYSNRMIIPFIFFFEMNSLAAVQSDVNDTISCQSPPAVVVLPVLKMQVLLPNLVDIVKYLLGKEG